MMGFSGAQPSVGPAGSSAPSMGPRTFINPLQDHYEPPTEHGPVLQIPFWKVRAQPFRGPKGSVRILHSGSKAGVCVLLRP